MIYKKTSLYVRQDIGKGNPLVLLHGLFADGTQWDKIAQLLSKDFRVIVVDLLGHGRSPRPKKAMYMPNEHVRALRATLESLHATNNVTIVGYSMGGTVALSYAADYSSEIEQLYLISSPFYLQPDQMIQTNYAGSVLVIKISQTAYRIVEKLLGKGRILTRAVGYADISKTFHKMIGAYDNKLDAEIIKLNIKNLVSEFDYAGTLARVKSPTTYYAGKKDPFIVQGQLYALKKFKPYMDIRRLDIIKVDHMLVQNLPKEISNLISANKDDLLHIGYDEGKGDVVVLLHGIESSSAYWKNLIPALAEHRRVIAIDLLGFGDSPKPKNIGYSIDDHVMALHKTLESLGLKSYSLAGHSLGGIIALAYAGSYPENVKRLTLFAPVFLPSKTSSDKKTVKGLRRIMLLPDTSLLYQQTVRFIGEDNIRQYMPAIRCIENSINKQDSVMYAKKARKIKAIFYYGSNDPLIDEYYLKTVASQFEDGVIKRLEGKKHNFAVFQPAIALNALDSKMPRQAPSQESYFESPDVYRANYQARCPHTVFKKPVFAASWASIIQQLCSRNIVIGLSLYVIFKGYKIIKGVFSLKNEVVYVGYVLLGILTIFIGYSLVKHPQKSLELGVFCNLRPNNRHRNCEDCNCIDLDKIKNCNPFTFAYRGANDRCGDDCTRWQLNKYLYYCLYDCGAYFIQKCGIRMVRCNVDMHGIYQKL